MARKRTSKAKADRAAADTLTARQRLFVAEYAKDCNGTQAAIRAGFSAKSAEVTASRLLRNAKVKAAVAEALATVASAAGIDATRVLEEIAALAYSDIGQLLDGSSEVPRLLPLNQLPEKARRAIASVKVRRVFEGKGDQAVPVDVIEFKLWPKTTALEQLAKHLGLLKERVEHSGPNGGAVPIRIIEVACAKPRESRKPVPPSPETPIHVLPAGR